MATPIRADEDALRTAVRNIVCSAYTPTSVLRLLLRAFSLRSDALQRPTRCFRTNARENSCSVTEALQSVAGDLNRSNAVVTLPPELLSCVANYLPLDGRVRVALVCRYWRSTILAASSLWSSLDIELGTRAHIWSAALDALFARSAGQPLSLELRVAPRDEWTSDELPAIRDVARKIELNMFRARSLSLQIPDSEEVHNHWGSVLAIRAPMLERFLLRFTDDSFDLPSELFEDHAPALTNVYLDIAILRPPVPQALHGLTILHCDDFDDVTSRAIASLEQLRKLSISAWRRLPYITICPQIIDLFLVGSKPTVAARSVVQTYFPHVKSIRYSLYYTEDDDGLDVLSRALDTGDEVTSLFIRWSEPLGKVSWEGTGRNTAVLAIEVNSALLAVDVLPQWFLEYLDSPVVLERFTSHLETATVTEEVWLLFMFVEAPRLQEASILLDEHIDYGKSALFSYAHGSRSTANKPALTTLRFSCQQRPPVKCYRNVAIPAIHLARHVQFICAGRKLPTLILRDIVPVDPGTRELENLVGVIRREDSIYCADAEELEPWTRRIESPPRDMMTL